MLVGDPLFGARREEVGCVTFVEFGRDVVRPIVTLLAAIAVDRFFWVMIVPVAMPLVTEEIIKPAPGRISRPFGGSGAALSSPPKPICRSPQSRSLQPGAPFPACDCRPGLCPIADPHVGMTLMDPKSNDAARGRKPAAEQ